MKWCRFENKGAASFGIIEGDDIIAVKGSPFESYQKTDERVSLKSAKLLVPVVPPTFYAAGLNYREHVIESAAKRGEQPKFPPEADVGYRANNALVGDGECWLTDEPWRFEPGEPFETYLRTVVLGDHLARIPAEEQDSFVRQVAAGLPDAVIDYVRLNIVARRSRR